MADSKIIKTAIKVVAFVAIFFAISYLLGEMLYPKSGNAHYALTEMYNAEEPPDVMIMGTSTSFRIAPVLVDELSGLSTMNMSTEAQSYVGAYTILSEAIDNDKKPDILLLYMSPYSLSSNGTNYDYNIVHEIPFGINRLRMTMDSFTIEEYPEALLKCHRARDQLFEPQMWMNIGQPEMTLEELTQKAAENHSRLYEDNPDILEVISYYGKGFNSISTTEIDLNKIEDEASIDTFSEENVDSKMLDYYHRIISLCKENDIQVILYSTPILPEAVLLTKGEGYQAFYDYATQLAAEDGLQFWDLNFIKEDVATIDHTMFSDSKHGNYRFVIPVSTVLGNMLKDYNEGTLDISNYLFDSMEEFRKIHPSICMIELSRNVLALRDSLRYIYLTLNAGDNDLREYRVSWSEQKDGEYTRLTDWELWTEKVRVDLSDFAPGPIYLQIEVRREGSNQIERVYTREYQITEYTGE